VSAEVAVVSKSGVERDSPYRPLGRHQRRFGPLQPKPPQILRDRTSHLPLERARQVHRMNAGALRERCQSE
jgi:hypothetical protein